MTDSHSAAPDVKRFSQLYPTPTVNPISNCTLNHEIHSQEGKIIHSDAVQRCYRDNLPPNLLSPHWLRSNKSRQVQLKQRVGTLCTISALGTLDTLSTTGTLSDLSTPSTLGKKNNSKSKGEKVEI